MTLASLSVSDGNEPDPRTLRRAPLGARFKIGYGVGAVIDGVTNTSLTYFLLFYLTAVCGLSGTLAGASSMLALVLDAIADPAIGLVSDNTRSRLGRRVPYMLYTMIPLAALFVLQFSIPPALKGLALFGYATLVSMALRFALSVFNLPYYAVGAEVSDDYAERSSIVSYRICFSMLGTFCAIALGLGVFMSGADGVLNRHAYMPFSWTCAGLILIAAVISTRAVKAELPRLHTAKRLQGPMLRQFLREIGEVFRNRSFLILFSATVGFFVASGAYGALTLYANRYFWQLPAATIQLLLVGITLGPFIGAPLNAFLSRSIDKRRLTIASLAIFSLSLLWPPLFRIADWLPPTGTTLVGILFGNALLSGASVVGAAIGFQSMMADAADEHEYLFGVRREGLFFSGITLAVKAASGLGGFIAGIALDSIHFPSQVAGTGPSVALAPALIRDLGLVSGPLPAAITLLAPLVLIAYTLSKSKHAQILTDLAQRRSQPASEIAPARPNEIGPAPRPIHAID